MSLEETILGHYKLLQLIGSGGMGEVYLAEDTRIIRRVAVKVVRSEIDLYANTLASQDAARLFQREMKAIAALDHPNILPLIDFGEKIGNHGVRTYLVMPYRPEGSLTHWLNTHGGTPLPQEKALPLIRQAAEALQHAHDHQILHLDVKAPNFLVRTHSENAQLPDLLLTDFGIARISTATATVSQSVRGTPYSMSPEQWMGLPVAASDQYSLAIMAYQLLTGVAPFQGSLHQMMYKHLQVSPQLPSTHNPLIPPAADTVLLRALAKKPDERFPSVQAFADALQSAWKIAPPTTHVTPVLLSPGEGQEYISTVDITPDISLQPLLPLKISGPPPMQVSQPTIHTSSVRRNFLIVLVFTLVAILVIGGTFTFIISTHSQQANILPNNLPQSKNTSTPDLVPIPNINYGHLLYTTTTPDNLCDKGGGQWGDYNNPGVQCSIAGTTLSNTNSISPALTGIILSAIPNRPYPNDYVIEAQMQQANTSSDFGLYFRNQPGKQLGTYTFFVHPNGTWGAYTYDNINGAQTQIASGPTSINAHSSLRVTIVVTGARFNFYINGQAVGSVPHDTTYTTGTTGIAVDAGGTVLVKTFSIYAIA